MLDKNDNPGGVGVEVLDYLDKGTIIPPFVRDLNEKTGLLEPSAEPIFAQKEALLTYLESSGHSNLADRVKNCGQTWIPYKCSAGHQMFRQTSCKVPLCPICSKKGSALNKKRANRVKDSLIYIGPLGHVVFTSPKTISESMPDNKSIDKYFKEASRICLEFFDAEAVVVSQHIFGDKKDGLHLHLDCIFPLCPTGRPNFFEKRILDDARSEWAKSISKISGCKVSTAVVHYNYAEPLKKQNHLINYNTRSTIPTEKFNKLSDVEKEYVIALSKRKLTRYFGKLSNKNRKEYLRWKQTKLTRAPRELLDQNICPICNEKMRAGLPVPMDDLPLTQLERAGPGCYIDRMIAAHIRDKERIAREHFIDPSLSLEEKIMLQEIFDIESKLNSGMR